MTFRFGVVRYVAIDKWATTLVKLAGYLSLFPEK